MIEDPSSAVPADSVSHRLDSWKDIATYLKRDVSTVQRWEKREGMPVHRHLHDKLGSVYAFPSELDRWSESRKMRLRGKSPEVTRSDEGTNDTGQLAGEAALHDRNDGGAIETSSSLPVAPPVAPAGARRFFWLMAALAVAALATTLAFLERTDYFWKNPLSKARFVRLTDLEGSEHSAAISRDGKFVAFLADRDGPLDVWVTQVGTGQLHNLTGGRVRELLNPDVRTIGFAPDATLVSLWTRGHSGSRPADIGVWSVPTLGGQLKPYLEGVAEFDWSGDGTRLVYHTAAAGDPLFVKEVRGAEKKIFTAASGLHNHFPVWSPEDASIYFVHGGLPDDLDIWRIDPAGGSPERITSHKSRVSHPTFLNRRTLLYLATDADGTGPWLYAVDIKRRRPRRISFGVERYTSLAASAGGRRLVVTVANSKRTLWRVPITDHVAEESAASAVTAPVITGRAPRVGPDYLIYVSSRSDGEGIWKLVDGSSTELWSIAGGRIIGGPAIAPDGRHIAFAAEDRGRTRLYVMNSDGATVRMMPESLEPLGAPAWAPDGRSIAVAAKIAGSPGLARVSVEQQTFVSLVAGFASDPAWTPDGASIVYSGSDVGTTFPIRMVSAVGRVQSGPKITLSRGARRVSFLPGQNALVILRGEMSHKNFWIIDLGSGRERRLTNFGRNFVIGDFDVSPDGREIVFDRERDNSDIVLIDR